MRVKSVTVVTCVGALALSAASADAARAPSRITLKQSNVNFSGKVKSPAAACLRDRTVRLWLQNFNGAHRRLIGKTHTTKSGAYHLTAPFDGSGNLYAQASRTSGCRGASSKKIPIYGT